MIRHTVLLFFEGNLRAFFFFLISDRFFALSVLTYLNIFSSVFFSEPFSTYKIYVRALVNGQESPDSDHISATTDVSQPSKPWITNLTCFDTGSLYVQWRRPELYHKGVDFYKVYYKQSIMPLFESITMQASEKTEEQKVI